MPLDIPAAPAAIIDSEPQFFEPLLPASASDDWQDILRQIFATEDGLWQRRAVVRQAAAAARG
jgi:hypothetical protein